jgi:hypothetical protein
VEAPRCARAAEVADIDTVAVFAGECVDLIHDIKPAADIITSLMCEAERSLAHIAAKQTESPER